MKSKAIVWMLAVAAVVGGAAVGCSISDIGNCGNQDVGAPGEGGAGGGAGGAGGGWIPLSATVPIDCGGIAMTAPDGGTKVELEMPNGSYLRWVSVTVTPPQGHAEIPAVLPEVRIESETHAPPAAPVVLASAIDVAADLASYEMPHKVIVVVAPTGPGVPIDNNAKLYTGVGIGEGATAGTVFLGWTCYVRLGTCSDMTTGLALPDGTSCGMKGTCSAGKCSED